jgi:hypothetical protein
MTIEFIISLILYTHYDSKYSDELLEYEMRSIETKNELRLRKLRKLKKIIEDV